MADTNFVDDEVDAGTLSRRRLLKGAAAVGAGAVAWSAPSIKTLGFTPAYAQVCTVGFTSYSLGERNTSCSCNEDGGSLKSAEYKLLGAPCTPGPAFPGTAELRIGDCNGAAIGNSGECPPGYGGQAGVCVTPTNNDLYCQAEVRLYTGGQCGGPYDVFFGSIQQGQSFLDLPPANCSGNGNIFIEVFVNCSTDPFCLT